MKNLIKDFAAVCLGAVVALMFYAGCHAAEPQEEAPLGAWSGDRPQSATEVDPKQVEPPAMSFGFQGCRQYAIWVFLKNGTSYRYDSEHHQIKSSAEMHALLDWLNKGPTDIVTITCVPVT